MAFRGWPVEAIEFYEGLEADNSRGYWLDHRSTYDNLVRRPMDELLAELAPEFGTGKVFRPNRDVRFSADKSPYKTALGATVGEAGYVQISAQGLGAGSGMWVMEADQLDRYRRAVADDGTGGELESIVAAVHKSGLDVQGHHVLKTAPRGYPKDHPRIDLLRNKGLIAWKQWPPGAWLGRRSGQGPGGPLPPDGEADERLAHGQRRPFGAHGALGPTPSYRAVTRTARGARKRRGWFRAARRDRGRDGCGPGR